MGRKRDAKTAQAQIDLQYGPQFAQIRDLFDQTKAQYANDKNAARQTAGSVQARVKASQPVVKGIFADASKGLQSSNSFVDKAMSTMKTPKTGLTTLLGQAMQRERGSMREQNTAARARSLNDLVRQGLGAEAGKALALQNARENYQGTRSQLSKRLGDLTGQSAAQMTVLMGQAADRRVKERAEKLKIDATKAKTQAGVDAAAQKRRDAAAKEHATHVQDVHKATDAYVNKIHDAISDWRRLANKQVPKMEPKRVNGKTALDPKTGEMVMQTVLDRNGNPVMERPGPDDIRELMLATRDEMGHAKYTPGDIHVALLVGNKPLDAAALAYLKRLRSKGVRIPKAWMGNATDQAIANNEQAGPPRPGR